VDVQMRVWRGPMFPVVTAVYMAVRPDQPRLFE